MDAKAKRILFRTYWSNGWIDQDWRSTRPEDFAYAKAQSVMFDPVTWLHDESVARIQQFREPSFAPTVGAGFVASLSSRRLDLRSALASWSMLERLAPHRYTPAWSGSSYGGDGTVVSTSHICGTCRDAPLNWQLVAHQTETDIDLNVLNFERLKWGGVRHDHLVYARFDLEQFTRADVATPTPHDWDLLGVILDTINTVPETTTAGGLVREVKARIPGTASEHRQLVEILGTSGILRPNESDRPEHPRSDWGAGGQWRGRDRYDKQRVRQLFPAFRHDSGGKETRPRTR